MSEAPLLDSSSPSPDSGTLRSFLWLPAGDASSDTHRLLHRAPTTASNV